MAIEFNCPHCQHAYRLKDEFAGKSATCKTCRAKLTIPQPVVVAGGAPRLTAEEIAEAEAKALAALADEQAQVEKDAAAQFIPIECQHCNHKWTEPLAKAGKNALCPECRQRVKIPEPKNDAPVPWNQERSKLPSMAKQNFEKLANVQDAADAKFVSGKALTQAGADGIEYEPRPLKQKVTFALVIVGALLGTTLGIRSCYVGRVERGEDRLMVEAQEEFAKSTGALPANDAPPEAQLCSALLYIAGGEHAARHKEPKIKEALEQFAKARDAIRKAPPSLSRNAVGGELAVAILILGGSEQQARDQVRIRWTPGTDLKTRPNERLYTVLDELRQSLELLRAAEFEFKNHLARRLSRELTKQGQGLLAVEMIPLALFNEKEQDEAKASIALEVLRTDKGSDLPRRVMGDLKGRGPELMKSVPTPASAQTLFFAVDPEKAPRIIAPPAGESMLESSRFAYVGKALVENQPDVAVQLAQRRGPPEGQIRALALCADWSADPGPALDAAQAILSANKGRKEISAFSVLRLAQIAAEKNKPDLAKELANLIADDGMKAWARGAIVQARSGAGSKDKADESWVELPPADKPKEVRAGHAWGLLWVARQNTRLSGDHSAELKIVNTWPTVGIPFGKAGIALGLQDN
ncbi:hypothetical protein VT84_18190 [Gemmata sp. SH-PL17]|uniref:hypothetical protein n=1 Tax=Gemmata sp. SH-PL17 TaxID=1630693 RepID=UPI00078B8DE0|nr:hypothetical protein [Gemmata sp. SH-PL17]AMV26333.1 hypothetical protein VT84_18190 [Gemmata sp. SH-PL17]